MRPKITYALLIFEICTTSCSTARHAAPAKSESTRVEVHTVTKTVHDTAYIEMPIFVERNITKDTSSTLENPYAKSEATVTNGYLKHSLETKQTKHPVEVEKEIVYRDSIVFRDRTVTQTVDVQAQLSKWQSFKMKTGGITLTLLTIAIVTAALYLLLKTKNFFKL